MADEDGMRGSFLWLDETRVMQEELFLPRSYGVSSFDELNPAQRANYWTVMSKAANDELGEFGREVNWKPWADDAGTVKDRAKAVKELIDVEHFLANLFVSLGVTDEEHDALYIAVMQRNRDRQTLPDGYKGVGDEDGLDGVAVVTASDGPVDSLTPFEALRVETYDGEKDLLRCRAEVSFWDTEVALPALMAASAVEPESYTLHAVRRDGGTVYVDASYVAGGANAAQLRRYAASLAQHCHRPVEEHEVTLVRTIETTLLKEGTDR